MLTCIRCWGQRRASSYFQGDGSSGAAGPETRGCCEGGGTRKDQNAHNGERARRHFPESRKVAPAEGDLHEGRGGLLNLLTLPKWLCFSCSFQLVLLTLTFPAGRMTYSTGQASLRAFDLRSLLAACWRQPRIVGDNLECSNALPEVPRRLSPTQRSFRASLRKR